MLREHTFIASEPCLRAPECKNPAEIRGVCRSCYNAFKEETAGYPEKEEACVRAGKILPAYGGKTAKEWFREAIEKK